MKKERKNLKKIVSLVMATLIFLSSASIVVYAEEKEVNNELYTLDEDFDKGTMDGVSYEEVHDQLQLKKQFKDFYSMFFTLQDIIIFGYEDNTNIVIKDQDDNVIWEGQLNKGQQKVLNVNRGVYKAYGNNKFSILTGDPVSNLVSGYYAMDQEGYGASTDIYTWVPQIFSYCKFIVFAMEDNTDVEVRDNTTDELIWSGKLNKGEHWEST